jgi:hypothetical protein
MTPQTGDILVSNRSATTDHDVSVVPERPQFVCPNHHTAVEKAHELAKARAVDVWLTEDHTHFMKLGTYRNAQPAARV